MGVKGVKIKWGQIVQNQMNKVVIVQALWHYLPCSGGDSETGPRDLAGTWHHPLYFPEDHCVGSQEWVFPVKENFVQFLFFDQQIWTCPTRVFYAVSKVCISTIHTQSWSAQTSLMLIHKMHHPAKQTTVQVWLPVWPQQTTVAPEVHQKWPWSWWCWLGCKLQAGSGDWPLMLSWTTYRKHTIITYFYIFFTMCNWWKVNNH